MDIKTLGRFVDQPLLLNKFHKKVPIALISLGSLYGITDTYINSKGKDKNFKKNKIIKNTIIIGFTTAAALIGANGLKINGHKIFSALIEQKSYDDIVLKQNLAIDKFIKNTNLKDKKILNILGYARKRFLNPKEVETIINSIEDNQAKLELFDTILPLPENLNAKDIFSEIGRLSMLGAVPVIGGIVGGIAADKVVGTNNKKNIANKIKEGFYQYFANIFLCNVGACISLFIAEALQKINFIKPLSPLKKMLIIMIGIVTTGIIGGSWIANKMSQKFIDPLFNNDKKVSHKGVYDERKPELTDMALHIDDIATAGVLSGFKWIEPALPLMYFISGYRAGIGYRNNYKT